MVKPFVVLSTLKSVVKTVVDATVEGYEVAYECYFNAKAQNPFESRSVDSLDDPKSCTD
jgi:hypothetical protein